jgi:hypothetical protein
LAYVVLHTILCTNFMHTMIAYIYQIKNAYVHKSWTINYLNKCMCT